MRYRHPAMGLAAITLLASTSAFANQINTGGEKGAYHGSFCPRLEAQLTKSRFKHKCTVSAGSLENMERVERDPRQLGYAQFDVFRLRALGAGKPTLQIVRSDDVRECVFAVSRNKELGTFGEISAYAPKLRFILPPEASGSAATFRFLQRIDAQGLGTTKRITYAKSTEDAIRQALANDDAVTFFVQFPDPDNALFKLVTQLGGHFVPVIDRAILREQVDGKKVYFAQETQVTNAKWVKTGTKVVTACTPLVLFTGLTEAISGDAAKKDHRDLIATIQSLKAADLAPSQSWFSRLIKRTRELSGQSAERMIELSEKARERARPYVEKAKDAGSKAIEAAKPALEKAKEMGSKALEKAKEGAKGLIERKEGEPQPK
ncbi:MAG: hypothetical protein KDJ41_10085 [Hyphomicrobiaceae bacterium]|nr:hypothetical protein [Hyphomicrobiaceae bacterium]